MNKFILSLFFDKASWLLIGLLACHPASAKMLNNSRLLDDNRVAQPMGENIYVASNNSVQQLFFVIAGALHKPFIVSIEAAKKRVSGNFNLNKPRELLDSVAARTGLIWYDDGSSVYVYDTSELQSSVVRLAYAPFDRLVAYLQSSGLYDSRFPLRSDGKSGSFYISGPPVYVELVSAAAKYIDATYARPGTGESTIRVIKLKNTFVNDRTFTQRDEPITIPGVASVLNQLLNKTTGGNGRPSALAGARITIDDDTRSALEAASATQKGNFPPLPAFSSAPAAKSLYPQENQGQQTISIVGYSDTNSLLIQGSERQVSFVEDLVNAIDIPKRQIQLSLWIIDISKDDINELGVRWQGGQRLVIPGLLLTPAPLRRRAACTSLRMSRPLPARAALKWYLVLRS